MKICDLELSRDINELGYEGDYGAWIDKDDGTIQTSSWLLYDWYIPCPRIDDVAYWILKKYKILISVYIYGSGFSYVIYKFYDEQNYWKYEQSYPGEYKEYEKALEDGVKTVVGWLKS